MLVLTIGANESGSRIESTPVPSSSDTIPRDLYDHAVRDKPPFEQISMHLRN